MRFVRLLLALALTAALLTACGAGDGDDDPATAVPTTGESLVPSPPPASSPPGAATPVESASPPPAAPTPGLVAAAQGDAARTGRQPGPGPAGTPAVQWTREWAAPVRGAPVLADGLLLVAMEGGGGALVAIDALTGDQRWRSPAGSAASPAVADGRVFLGTSGAFNAYDLGTGEVVWSFPTGSDRWTSAVVADGAVYVTDLQNGVLYALDVASGRQRWNLRNFNGAPSAFGGVVYAAGPDGLFALDAATGSLRWLAYMDAVGYAAVVDGRVYVVAQALRTPPSYHLLALDDQGGERWRVELGTVPPTSPVVSADGRLLYVVADPTGNGASLFAHDVNTGDLRLAADAESLAAGELTVAGGRVYFAGLDGTVRAFDAASGVAVWSAAAIGEILTAPVVAGDLLYLGNAGPDAGALIALGAGPEPASPVASPSAAATPPAAATPLGA